MVDRSMLIFCSDSCCERPDRIILSEAFRLLERSRKFG